MRRYHNGCIRDSLILSVCTVESCIKYATMRVSLEEARCVKHAEEILPTPSALPILLSHQMRIHSVRKLQGQIMGTRQKFYTLELS